MTQDRCTVHQELTLPRDLTDRMGQWLQVPELNSLTFDLCRGYVATWLVPVGIKSTTERLHVRTPFPKLITGRMLRHNYAVSLRGGKPRDTAKRYTT